MMRCSSIYGPETSDFPARLYQVSTSLSWMYKLSPDWSVHVGVTPSLASDFEAMGGEAFRVTGHAFATHKWSPEWQFLFGVVYLNRNDLSVLPMAGAVWTPSEELRIELTVPQPPLTKKVWLPWDVAAQSENWIYLAGELGGGTCNVTEFLSLRTCFSPPKLLRWTADFALRTRRRRFPLPTEFISVEGMIVHYERVATSSEKSSLPPK